MWPGVNIVDLVTERGRERRKEIFLDVEETAKVDVVLSARILDEGADWPQAEQVLDLAPSNSLRIQVQRCYRLWRDYKGKRHISLFIFLPYVGVKLGEEEFRQQLSNNYTALTGAMLIQEMMQPTGLMLPRPKRTKQTLQPRRRGEGPFTKTITDPNDRQAILDEIQIRLGILKDTEDDSMTDDAPRKCIEQVLTDYGTSTSDASRIAKHIVRMFVARLPQYNVNILWMRQAGWDKIMRNEVLDDIRAYGTSCADYKSFRDIYGSRCRNWLPESEMRKFFAYLKERRFTVKQWEDLHKSVWTTGRVPDHLRKQLDINDDDDSMTQEKTTNDA